MKDAKTKGAGMFWVFFFFSSLQCLTVKAVKLFLGQCTVARKWNFYCSSCFCAGEEQWEAINGNIKLPSCGGQQQEADQYSHFWFVRLLWRCLQLSQMSVQRHKKTNKKRKTNILLTKYKSYAAPGPFYHGSVHRPGTSKGNVFKVLFFFCCCFLEVNICINGS